MMNKFLRAACRARRNIGLGEVEQDRIKGKQPENLFDAVQQVMGQFAEGEDHMDIFMEEAQQWLEQESS